MTATGADIAVKGGVLVNSQGMQLADLFLKDGRIDSVEPTGSSRSANRVIDATHKYVLPGIIDAHLHPVYADRIDTLSRAAIHGGVTTLIPFIGGVKAWGAGGSLLDAIQDFIKEGEASSSVDFSLHCSIIHDDMSNIDEVIPKVIALGINSFKAFMAYSKRGMMLSDTELLKIMEIIAREGGLLAIHAESGTILDYLEMKFETQGKKGPEFYEPAHPSISEAEALFRILSLAAVTGCPMYLPHLTCWEGLDVVRLFKSWGTPDPIFTETCPHYLTLTDEEMTRRGSLAKVAPPLRRPKDVAELWRAINEGLIDVIGSDAAGYYRKKKEPFWDEVFNAPSGLPGQQTMFTVPYDEGVNKGITTLPKLIELTCENPAKIFGLYPRKGVIEPGSDGDLVVFAPFRPHTITAENQHTHVDYTMYDGRQCLGGPIMVIQRGQILLEDGRLLARPGQGQFLPGKNNSNK